MSTSSVSPNDPIEHPSEHPSQARIELYDALMEQLLKAEALVQVALGEGFLDNSKFIINHYLSVIGDLLKQVNEKCHQLFPL